MVVIGIGINCALGTALTRRVQASGTEPIDLAALGSPACDRNELAALLLDEIVRGALDFEARGLSGFAPEWAARCARGPERGGEHPGRRVCRRGARH